MKDKKALICDAVFDLLNDNDISKVTVSNIAVKADIGKGTIYEYFDSKDDIFRFAVESRFESFIDQIKDELADDGSDFKTVIFKLLDKNIELMKNNKSFFDLVINPPGFLIENFQRKEQTCMKMMLLKDEMQRLIDSILTKALEKGEINRKDMLRQTMFLPMLISFLLRVTKAGFWQDIGEQIDVKNEKEEFFNIILGLFS